MHVVLVRLASVRLWTEFAGDLDENLGMFVKEVRASGYCFFRVTKRAIGNA